MSENFGFDTERQICGVRNSYGFIRAEKDVVNRYEAEFPRLSFLVSPQSPWGQQTVAAVSGEVG